MNLKKKFLIPFFITFGVLFGILLISFFILYVFFPLSLSTFCYKLGMENASLTYLERSYKQSQDYNQLYSVLNFSIKLDKTNKIVKYYEEFSNGKNYKNFIEKIDKDNQNLDVKPFVKSKLFSEDNYLKNKYVYALNKNGDLQKAYSYANNYFSSDIDINSIPLYLYKNILVAENLGNLQNIADLSVQLESYYNKCVKIFNDNKNDTGKIINLFVIGDRINQVAINLKAIKNFNSNYVTLTIENINSQVREINTTMSTLSNI